EARRDGPRTPRRFIVKYRPTVDACAHCLVEHGIPFATVTGSSSLDVLDRHYGVRSARPLTVGPHGVSSGRTAAQRATLDQVRARFPARSARAAAGALVPAFCPRLSLGKRERSGFKART